MAVETRVIIDANASNAIREIDKLDAAAADADKTLDKLDGATVDIDARGALNELDDVDRAAADAKGALDKLDAEKVTITVDTSDVVTAAGDVDQLAGKVREPMRIDIDVDADRLDTVKRKLDDVGDSGRAGGTAIGGIGGSISELPGVGALGPIAESLGQLTENALEGGESIAGIGKALGVLGGAAAVMYGIGKAMQSIADTKAFDAAQVESFRDALEETGDAADAVLATIKEAAGIKGRTGGIFGLFEGTKDVTAALTAAGVAGEEFIAAVTPGPGAAAANQELTDKLIAQRQAVDDAQLALRLNGEFSKELNNESQALGDAIEVVNETLALNQSAMEESSTWAAFLGGNMKQTAVEFKGTTDAAGVATGAVDLFTGGLVGATTAALNLKNANAELRGDLDKRQSYLNLLDTFDAVENAGKEAWYAVASGAENAESATRDYEQQQIAAKIQLQDYLDKLEDVPASKQTEIQTLIDKGDLAEAERQLAILTRQRELNVNVKAQIDPRLQDSRFGFRAGGTSAPTAVSNLTVNVTARPSMLDVDTAIGRWSRMNGARR